MKKEGLSRPFLLLLYADLNTKNERIKEYKVCVDFGMG
jgi:hypothetical protein